MKISKSIAKAIATLFVLAVAGFEMLAESPMQLPPTCGVVFVTYGCVKDDKGKPIYVFSGVQVTQTLGCAATVTVTASSGTVLPGTFTNINSGNSIAFTVINAGTTAPTLTFSVSGCGKQCKVSKSPTSPPSCGSCLTFFTPQVSACTGQQGNLCLYPFTVKVNNLTSIPGTLTLASSVGTLSSSSYNINGGINTVSGTLAVPCGTTSGSLTGQVTVGTTTGTQSCTATTAFSLPACVTPPQCGVQITAVSCVFDANGKPLYNVTATVTHNLGCAAALTIIPNGGTVQPSTFANVSNGGTVAFTLSNAPASPSFTFNLSGCGKSCTTSGKLPALPTNCGGCFTLAPGPLMCKQDGNSCAYNFTLTLTNNTNSPGPLALATSVGTLSQTSYPITPGVGVGTIISGQLLVPCGTTQAVLTGNLAVGQQLCKVSLTLTLPACVNPCDIKATAKDQVLCTGGATQIDLPPGTQGNVMWYSATNCNTTALPPLAPWTALSGGTTWYTLPLTQTTCYVAVITGVPGCPGPVVTPKVTVTVIDTSAASIQCSVNSGACPPSGELCSGSTVTLTLQGLNANCPLQWEQSINNGAYTPIPNATTATLTQTLTSTACPFTTYRFRVLYACKPCAKGAREVTFNVYSPSKAGTLTAFWPNPRCEGDDNTLTLANYCGKTQWQMSTNGTTFTNIAGATGNSVWYTNPLMHDTWYQVVVQNGPCPPVTSNAVHIVVTKKPTVTVSASGPLQFCDPGSVMLTASVTPAGGTYQWFYNGLPAVPPGSGPTYQATQTGNYYVFYKTPCGKVKSTNIKVKVSKIVAAIQGACGVCTPGCVTLQAVAAGGIGGYTYSWTTNPPTSVLTGQSINVCPTQTTTYTVLVKDALGCTKTASHTVNVCKKLTVNAGPGTTICLGGNVTLNAAASGGAGGYTYSWSPAGGLSSTTVANPTASPALTTTYTVTVTDAAGCKATATVTVKVKPISCNPDKKTGPL